MNQPLSAIPVCTVELTLFSRFGGVLGTLLPDSMEHDRCRPIKLCGAQHSSIFGAIGCNIANYQLRICFLYKERTQTMVSITRDQISSSDLLEQ